jgi:hypothetical protein
MNEIIFANLLFQAGAGVVLMLVAGISAARQLHARRSVATCSVVPQESRTVVELPAPRMTRVAPSAELEAHSEAA